MATSPEPQTWHCGIVAKWWPESLTNVDAPEIDDFRRFVDAGNRRSMSVAESVCSPCIEQDEQVRTKTSCYTHELTTMIERAGFSTIELWADYTESEPTANTDFVVFIARKPTG